MRQAGTGVRSDRRSGGFETHIQRGGVIALSGELDCASAPTLQRVLDTISRPGGEITLDLHDLRFMGLAGLNVLVAASDALGPEGRVVLYRPQRSVARLLELTGFDRWIRRETTPR